MARAELNRDEIQYLVTRMLAGRTWAQAKGDLVAAVYDLSSTDWDANYETTVEAEVVVQRKDFGLGAEARIATSEAGLTPTATSISPDSGPARGGTRVELTGTGFRAGDTVTLGGHACTIEHIEFTKIIFLTPAHAAETNLHLVVSDGSLTSELTDIWDYVANTGPTAAAVVPTKLSADGGTKIHISGTDFAVGDTVTVGAHSCTVTSVTPVLIVAETPAHAAEADLDVVVSDGVSPSTLSGAVDYVAAEEVRKR